MLDIPFHNKIRKKAASTYQFQATSQGESWQVRPILGTVEARSQSLRHLGHAM